MNARLQAYPWFDLPLESDTPIKRGLRNPYPGEKISPRFRPCSNHCTFWGDL
jgi:hypothetical protein